MFAFKDEDEFFDHIVTHDTQDRPGELPRTRHTIHCQLCGEETLHGDTPSQIRQAFVNARQDHHLRVLAARMKDLERAEQYRDGGELLGG